LDPEFIYFANTVKSDTASRRMLILTHNHKMAPHTYTKPLQPL